MFVAPRRGQMAIQHCPISVSDEFSSATTIGVNNMAKKHTVADGIVNFCSPVTV
jgi:hypothetical protein